LKEGGERTPHTFFCRGPPERWPWRKGVAKTLFCSVRRRGGIIYFISGGGGKRREGGCFDAQCTRRGGVGARLLVEAGESPKTHLVEGKKIYLFVETLKKKYSWV